MVCPTLFFFLFTSSGPLSFNDVDGVTAQGRVFETKICPGCTELLIKCRSSDQAAVLVEHGTMTSTSI